MRVMHLEQYSIQLVHVGIYVVCPKSAEGNVLFYSKLLQQQELLLFLWMIK